MEVQQQNIWWSANGGIRDSGIGDSEVVSGIGDSGAQPAMASTVEESNVTVFLRPRPSPPYHTAPAAPYPNPAVPDAADHPPSTLEPRLYLRPQEWPLSNRGEHKDFIQEWPLSNRGEHKDFIQEEQLFNRGEHKDSRRATTKFLPDGRAQRLGKLPACVACAACL